MTALPQKLILFIDAENLPATCVDQILNQARQWGTIISMCAIGGQKAFNCQHGWQIAMQEKGIEARPLLNFTPGKNHADHELVIAVMDCLHENICDGFVICSSDSDFTALVHRLRRSGKVVYGVGNQNTPNAFRSACNAFHQLISTKQPSQISSSSPSVPPKTESKNSVLDESDEAVIKQICNWHGKPTSRNTLINSIQNLCKDKSKIQIIFDTMKQRKHFSVDSVEKLTWSK